MDEYVDNSDSVFDYKVSLKVYTSHPIIEFIYTGEWEKESKSVTCTITDCMTRNTNGTYGKAELNYFYFAYGDEDEANTRVDAVNRTNVYNYRIGRSINGAQGFIFEEDNKGLKNDIVFKDQMVRTVDEMFEYIDAYILSKAGVPFGQLGFRNLNLSI